MSEAVQTVHMSRTRMTETEFQSQCHKHCMSMTKACDLVFIRTSAIIKPVNIRKSFRDYGFLSEPMSAMFRLLFLMLDEQGVQDGKVSRQRDS